MSKALLGKPAAGARLAAERQRFWSRPQISWCSITRKRCTVVCGKRNRPVLIFYFHRCWPFFTFDPSRSSDLTDFSPRTGPSTHTLTHVLFGEVFFGVKLNVALQVMVLTVDCSFLGSWSADGLCSTAEFPCHIWLAADLRASYSDCEDKQVGRGGHWVLGREVAEEVPQSVQARLHAVSVRFLGCTPVAARADPAAAGLGFSEHHKPCGAGSMCLVVKILHGGSAVSVWVFWVLSLLLRNSLIVEFLLWISQQLLLEQRQNLW